MLLRFAVQKWLPIKMFHSKNDLFHASIDGSKSFFGHEKEKNLLRSKKCAAIGINGILLPKLVWPTVRKNCSIDREKNLKFANIWDFLNNLFKQWKFKTFGSRMLF